MLNSVLYHVCLSWMIYSNKQIRYEIEENNTDWLNKGPWYNTTICSKFHETLFEDFIMNYRTDRYNIMCSINSRYRKQSTYILVMQAVLEVDQYLIMQLNQH